MTFLKLLPVILSSLILGAHFSRANLLSLTILCVLILLILFIRASWVPRVLQLFLYLGTAEWLRTLFTLIDARQALNQEWLRMAVIIAAVALFTLLSTLVFRGKAIQERYYP